MINRKLLLTLSAGMLVTTALVGSLLSRRGQAAPGCLEPNLAAIPSPMPQKNPRSVTPGVPLVLPAWWKPQLNADQQAQYEDIRSNRKFYAAQDILVYEGQVWLAHARGVARFDTANGMIRAYEIASDPQTEAYSVDALYLRKGEIWAILSSSESAIARYDSSTDEFIIVHDKDGLLIHGHGPTVDSKPLIGELTDGNLVFVLGWEIFTYDPANERAEKLLGLESGFRVNTIAISSDDSIWFTTVNDYMIRSLDPETGKLKEYGEPPSLVKDEANQTGLAWDSSKAIIVDYKGRVWIGYFDRLEPDRNGNYAWHKVERPTIFVDDTHIYETYDRAVYVYKWSPVISVTQFSDGTMWFATGVGVVQYDVARDTWCWRAPQPYLGNSFPLIAEDEHGDIWMVTPLYQIYKLQR